MPFGAENNKTGEDKNRKDEKKEHEWDRKMKGQNFK
jgi:hypothetical protein